MQPIRIVYPGICDNPPHADLYYGIDVLDGLKLLPDKSVQVIATSPPYWGLRSYGVVGQLGAEKTPEEFVHNLVAVFCEARRVLRDDGILYLNLGDSYASQGGRRSVGASSAIAHTTIAKEGHLNIPHSPIPAGLKNKDLVGIPWMVAFALRADGWYLRNDCIWSKISHMPEAVTDRLTKAHEYIFMFTKNPSYFYDQDAIREPHAESSLARVLRGRGDHKWVDGPGDQTLNSASDLSQACHPSGKNKGTVWSEPETLVALREDLSPEVRNSVLDQLKAKGLL